MWGERGGGGGPEGFFQGGGGGGGGRGGEWPNSKLCYPIRLNMISGRRGGGIS